MEVSVISPPLVEAVILVKILSPDSLTHRNRDHQLVILPFVPRGRVKDHEDLMTGVTTMETMGQTLTIKRKETVPMAPAPESLTERSLVMSPQNLLMMTVILATTRPNGDLLKKP